MALRWTHIALVTSVILLVGSSTLLVEDSPYDSNIEVERNPIAPTRPATLNATTSAEYVVAHEQRLLYNDLLSSRSHSLDMHDSVVADCESIGVDSAMSQAETTFGVELQCHGDIDDTKRLFEPSGFTYEVIYRVTENETEVVEINEYPLGERGNLWTEPPE